MRPPLPLPAPPPLPPPPDFLARAAALGAPLDAATAARVGDYLARLLAMNEQMNLTAITDPEAVWSRHALDALSLVPGLARFPAGARILDLGSGGGVPGIVLALARPDLSFTLLEATAKKAAFLSEVAAALGLPNVEVWTARAEQLHTGPTAPAFDAVTARAVGKIEVLVPWAAPLVKPGGRLLFIKGERADEERAAAQRQLMHHRVRHKRTVVTPTGRVVVFEVG